MRTVMSHSVFSVVQPCQTALIGSLYTGVTA
jgi:hypothetical protein